MGTVREDFQTTDSVHLDTGLANIVKQSVRTARNSLSQVLKSIPFSRRVAMVASVVPSALWWRTSVTASWMHGQMMTFFGHSDGKLTEALMLDHWLREFTYHGAFKIPYRVVGAEHIRRLPQDKGILFCGVHIPLCSLNMRGLIESGTMPDVMIAHPDGINAAGRYLPPGDPIGCAAVAPGVGGILRARTIFNASGSVISTIDERIGDPLQPQMLQLAGRLGARVVILSSQMGSDGIPVLTFAPFPIPDTEEKVQAVVDILARERDRVYDSLRGKNPGRSQNILESSDSAGGMA